MKNVTLSAVMTSLSRPARAFPAADPERVFRKWLLQYTAQNGCRQEVDALMRRLRHVSVGVRFSRDEVNER